MFPRKKIDFEKILLKYIDGDFELAAAGKDAPNISDLNTFEKLFKIKLPSDFKDFSLSPLSGLWVEVKEEIWPRPQGLEVGPFWSFLYGFTVFGFSSVTPEPTDMKIHAIEFKNQVNNDYIPFMKIIGDPDVHCFNKKGVIYTWDHELNIFKKANMSFVKLLEYEAAELRGRKDKKKQKQEF